MKNLYIIAALLVAFSASQAQQKDSLIIRHRVGGLRTVGSSVSVHFSYADTLFQTNKGTIVVVKQKNGKFKHYHFPQGQSISIDYVEVFIQE